MGSKISSSIAFPNLLAFKLDFTCLKISKQGQESAAQVLAPGRRQRPRGRALGQPLQVLQEPDGPLHVQRPLRAVVVPHDASPEDGRHQEQVPAAQGQPGLSLPQCDRVQHVRSSAQVNVSPPSRLGLNNKITTHKIHS
jgi:hypothetical protein